VIWKRGNEGAGPPYRSISIGPWHPVVEAIANEFDSEWEQTTLMAFLLSEGTTKAASTSPRETGEIAAVNPADSLTSDPMTPNETRFSTLERA
jgi:hypothetical protein